LEDRRKAGESSCNSGDGTDQRVQTFMFMMMVMMMMMKINEPFSQSVLRLRRLLTELSPLRPLFNARAPQVGTFSRQQEALVKGFLTVLRFSSASIIPAMLHTQTFFYQRYCMISATDSFFI
jgi:hypothetical protein